MTPEQYADKVEARRTRLENAAVKAEAASTDAYQRSRAATAGIPFGQPILVGHHSEGRHRNALKRSDTAMRKACELSDAAKEYAWRAAAVGTGGISSDDPEAIAKLADKRTELEQKRDHMKLVNKLYKKRDLPALAALGITDIERLDAKVAEAYAWEKAPYASWEITNLSARIRDAAKRAATIEQTATIPASVETIGDATITVDPDDNRVQIAFPARLSRDDYEQVRQHGFVWSPTRNAFVRKLNTSALWNARRLAESLIKVPS